MLCGKGIRAGYALFRRPVMATGPLEGKSQEENKQVFMALVFALHVGKAVVQVAAIEIVIS